MEEKNIFSHEKQASSSYCTEIANNYNRLKIFYWSARIQTKS